MYGVGGFPNALLSYISLSIMSAEGTFCQVNISTKPVLIPRRLNFCVPFGNDVFRGAGVHVTVEANEVNTCCHGETVGRLSFSIEEKGL